MKSSSVIAVLALAAILSASTCRADDDLINATPVSDIRPYVGADSMSLLHRLAAKNVPDRTTDDRASRQTPALFPELISRLPVSKVFDAGAKALNIARYWPAGLASLVVGTAPTTGAIVGVIAISIFIIVIWLTIYSIGVLPVGAALLAGRQDVLGSPYGAPGVMPYPGQPMNGPYPYHRFQRSLADASRTVMDAIDKLELENNSNKN